MADLPMSLGDHLEELRRRIILPVVIGFLAMVIAFVCQAPVKRVLVWPLERAVVIIGPAVAKELRIPADSSRLLQFFELGESIMTSVQVSMIVAGVVVVPVMIYELWMFIAIGLKTKERRLGFLFLPLGVSFFYVGLIIGYLLGVPYFFAWMLKLTANDPTAQSVALRASTYYSTLLTMTVCFGLVMDIPWLVMVLVRSGLLTPEQIAAKRRWVVMINVIFAMVITPPDVTSMMVMFIPITLLFEAGLFASRFLRPLPRTAGAGPPGAVGDPPGPAIGPDASHSSGRDRETER